LDEIRRKTALIAHMAIRARKPQIDTSNPRPLSHGAGRSLCGEADRATRNLLSEAPKAFTEIQLELSTLPVTEQTFPAIGLRCMQVAKLKPSQHRVTQSIHEIAGCELAN
jgi:hypothetical protein